MCVFQIFLDPSMSASGQTRERGDVRARDKAKRRDGRQSKANLHAFQPCTMNRTSHGDLQEFGRSLSLLQ